MPTYDLRNTETGEEKEIICSYNSMKEMTDSGAWEQVHKSASTMSHTLEELSSKLARDGKTY